MTAFTITISVRSVVRGWSNPTGHSSLIEGYAVASSSKRIIKDGLFEINLCAGGACPLYQSITGVPQEFFDKLETAIAKRNSYTVAELTLNFTNRELTSVRVDNRIVD